MAYKLRIDMTGVRYGRLVGTAYSHRSRSGHSHWLFACDCGGRLIANGANVRAGNTTSCGCAHREISAARLHVHGRRTAKRHDATYRAWQAMNDSCSNPASPKYDRCGARGVAVCAAWKSDFTAFVADMGERPHNAILSREDEDGDFSRSNCAWILARRREDRAIDGWKARRTLDLGDGGLGA